MSEPKELAVREPQIITLLRSEKVKQELQLVMPPDVNVDALVSRAKLAVLSNNDLLNCTPQSILMAVKRSVAAGLELNGRDAHLVPYGKTAQFIVDYKGFIALGKRCGLRLIRPELVRERDNFMRWVDETGPHHRHTINDTMPRGKVVMVYSQSIDQHGVTDFEYMSAEEIEEVRKSSRCGSGGPWKSHWEEMAKKTVIRRHSKRWDIDTRFKRALDNDDDRMANAAVAKAKLILPDESAASLPAPATANLLPERSDNDGGPDEEKEHTWE